MILNFMINGAIVKVKIDNKKIFLSGPVLGINTFVPMENLMIAGGVAGILKEFPDLKGYEPENMKIEAVKRFKARIDAISDEEEMTKYVTKELKKQGMVLIK